MNLVEITEQEKLDKTSMISGALKTRISAGRMRRVDKEERILNAFSEKLMNKLASLKFVSYIDNAWVSGHHTCCAGKHFRTAAGSFFRKSLLVMI